MKVSHYVAETAMKKAMSLRLFLRLMYMRDDKSNDNVASDMHAVILADQAGFYLGVSKSFVYNSYKEWRFGQEERAIESLESFGAI